jgi:hypothetical protein
MVLRTLSFFQQDRGVGASTTTFVSMMGKIKKGMNMKKLKTAFIAIEDEDTWVCASFLHAHI